jgi:hypothetical protein
MRAADGEVQSCSKTIAAYLMERVEEFRGLSTAVDFCWHPTTEDFRGLVLQVLPISVDLNRPRGVVQRIYLE